MAALWLSLVVVHGSAPVGPADLIRFGLTRSTTPAFRWADPVADCGYRAACDRLNWCQTPSLCGLRQVHVDDATWRRDVWYVVWWATDGRYDPAKHLALLRSLIGPAYYGLGRLPAPVPWRGWN